MPNTSSLAWPNMFNVSQNSVIVLEDNQSVVNRTKLLILTEPTEVYNEPNQGVGLKRHLWQYNTDNQKAIIKDRIVEQLRLHEPSVLPDDTQFADGLLFTGNSTVVNPQQEYNTLNMTVAVKSIFGDVLEVTFNTNATTESSTTTTSINSTLAGQTSW